MQKQARKAGLDAARADQLPSKQSVALFSRRLCVSLLAASLAITSLLSGCGTGDSLPQYENTAGDAADLHVIPQNLAFFAERFVPSGQISEQGSLGADTLLRSHAEAVADMASFRRAFFQPWDMQAASAEAVQDALDILARTPERRGFAENMHPWSDEAWQKLCARADIPGLEALLTAPRAPRAAITVRRTDLRAVPTLKPRFSEMHGAGQGWPFDLFQYSALPAGLPLAVHHRSTDGAWLFVETSGIWGWMPAEDAAFAGAEFCQLWRKSGLTAFVRDDVALHFKNFHHGRASMSGKAGAFLAEAGIGTVLPMVSGELLLPWRGPDGMTHAVTVSCQGTEGRVVESGDAFSVAVPMPQSLTPRKVAEIGDSMMGQSYGWGGLYGGRDCSAMMRDLFAPFGIWLPRNSGYQAEAGARTMLEGARADAKERALLDAGRPFRTLIWMPGHIGLYVGEWQGRAAMFHNVWGLRTTLDDGREARAVLGRAAVTSLRPGAERDDVEPERLLIERVGSLTVIGGEYSE